MSEGQTFYAFMALFYLWSSLRPATLASSAIRKCHFTQSWTVCRDLGLLAGLRKQLFLSPLLPWPSQIIIAHSPPLSTRPPCSLYSAKRLLTLFHRSSAPLRLLSLCLLSLFFAVIPLCYIIYGDKPPTLIAIGLSFFTMLVIAIYSSVLHRHFAPNQRADRYKNILLTLTLPWHAMRICDELMHASALARLHPLTLTALADTPESRRQLARFYRESIYKSQAVYPSQVIEHILQCTGISVDDFLAPPKPEDPSCTHYCPCCHHFFTDAVSHCSECDNIPLLGVSYEKISTF